MKKNSSSFEFAFGVPKKKKDDKSSFLASTKRQKEQREILRNEQKSALKIQTFYRQVSTRAQYLSQLEGEALKKLSDLSKIKAMVQEAKFLEALAKV